MINVQALADQQRLATIDLLKQISRRKRLLLVVFFFISVNIFIALRYVRTRMTNRALMARNRELKTLSMVDNLTGIYNRHYLHSRDTGARLCTVHGAKSRVGVLSR